MHSSKKFLSVVLAVLLTVVIIPFSAFAEMFAVTGVITDIGDNYYTLSIQGQEHTYYFDDDTEFTSDYFNIGDTAQITVVAEDPDLIVQMDLIRVGNPPERVRHTHYSVTGIITDATMNSITVFYKGSYRTFGKSDAEIVGAPDGLALGDTVKITYYGDDPQTAVRITMVAHGENHDNRPADTVSHYSVTGVVADATMNNITIYTKGKYRTFNCDDRTQLINAEDGVALGDTVRIVYHHSDSKLAVKIYMVREGDNH